MFASRANSDWPPMFFKTDSVCLARVIAIVLHHNTSNKSSVFSGPGDFYH